MKRIFLVFTLLLVAVSAQAQVNLGANYLLGNTYATIVRPDKVDISTNNDLGMNPRKSFLEFNAGIVTPMRAAARGYWLIQTSHGGSGELQPSQYDDKEKKPLPVSFDRNFNAYRVELGYLVPVRSAFLEPFLVNQWLVETYHITYTGKDTEKKKYNHDVTLNESNIGVGLCFYPFINKWSTGQLKFFATSKCNFFEARYVIYEGFGYGSIGYQYRTFQTGNRVNINSVISGPFAELGLVF